MFAPNPPGGRKTRKLAKVEDDGESLGSLESSAWNAEIANHRKRLRESKTPKTTRKTAKKEPKDGAKEPVKIATRKSVAKPQKPIPRVTTEDRIIVQQNKLFDNVKGFH